MPLTTDSAELRAYSDSIRQSVAQIVAELRTTLGAKLVAYIGGVRETRAVREWASGERKPAPVTEQRLRTAHRIMTLIERSEGAGIAAPWFQGMNPILGDRSPARVLHEDRSEDALAQVLAAANSFVA